MATTTLEDSVERTNKVTRLCQLLVDVGADALRGVFDQLQPPSTLASSLNSYKHLLENLRHKHVFYWDLLFPTEHGTLHYPDSYYFDIALLSVLLKTICGLKPPTSSWDKLPSEQDNSLEANLARLMYYRNEVYSCITTGVYTAKFDCYWLEISSTLENLGIDRVGIAELLETSPLEVGKSCYEGLIHWVSMDQQLNDAIPVLLEEQKDSKQEIKVWPREVLLDYYKIIHMRSKSQPEIIEQRLKQLSYEARHYLSSVKFSKKFFIVKFDVFMKEALRKEGDGNAKTLKKMQTGFQNLEKFGVNLMKFPWQREFYTIKLYTCFYKDGIESKVSFGPAVLELYGYKSKSNELAVLQEPLNIEDIAATSFELFLSAIELEVMLDILHKVSDQTDSFSLEEIFKARVKTIGDLNEAVSYFNEKKNPSMMHKRFKLDKDQDGSRDSPKHAKESTDDILRKSKESYAMLGHEKTTRDTKYPPGIATSMQTGASIHLDNAPMIPYDATHQVPVKYVPPAVGGKSRMASSTYMHGESTLAAFDCLTDAELYGQVNGHAPNALVTQKHAQSNTSHEGIRAVHLQGQLTGAVAHLNDYPSALHHLGADPRNQKRVYSENSDSYYENIWEGHTDPIYENVSTRPGRTTVQPPCPPAGIPPPSYSHALTRDSPKPQELHEQDGFVVIDKGTNAIERRHETVRGDETRLVPRMGEISLGSNVNHPPITDSRRTHRDSSVITRSSSPGVHRRGLRDVSKVTDAYPGVAVTAKAFDHPSGSPKVYHVCSCQADEIRAASFPAVFSRVKGSNIASFFPVGSTSVGSLHTDETELEKESTEVAVPRSVTESGRVTRSKTRDVSLGKETDISTFKDVTIEQQRTEVPSSSVRVNRSREGASTSRHKDGCDVCGSYGTHECKLCSKVYCDNHVKIFDGLLCKNSTEHHIFVQRRPESTTIDPEVVNPNKKTICDFCGLPGAFMCKGCFKLSCKECLKIFQTDLCGVNKGNHDFVDLAGKKSDKTKSTDGSETPWSCERCTFKNLPEHNICVVCATSRGVKEISIPPSGSRKCGVCTYGNEEGARICKMCHNYIDLERPESYI